MAQGITVKLRYTELIVLLTNRARYHELRSLSRRAAWADCADTIVDKSIAISEADFEDVRARYYRAIIEKLVDDEWHHLPLAEFKELYVDLNLLAKLEQDYRARQEKERTA